MKRFGLTRRGWAVMVYAASMLALALGSFFMVTYSINHNNQRWCALLETLDSAYHQVPATTPTGRAIAAEIHDLVATYDCPPGTSPQ